MSCLARVAVQTACGLVQTQGAAGGLLKADMPGELEVGREQVRSATEPNEVAP